MPRDASVAGRTESKMPQVVDFFAIRHTMQWFSLVPSLDR